MDFVENSIDARSEEHTSELQSPDHLVCRLLLEKKKQIVYIIKLFSHIDCLTTISPHSFFFFFNPTPTTYIYTLSLHDALPISSFMRKKCCPLSRPRVIVMFRAEASMLFSTNSATAFNGFCREQH